MYKELIYARGAKMICRLSRTSIITTFMVAMKASSASLLPSARILRAGTGPSFRCMAFNEYGNRRCSISTRTAPCLRQSVTGEIYVASDADAPVVKLFTREGCTLCDKVKDVLQKCAADEPHTLLAVDITDADKREWWSKYKYDIPVLHINDEYWAKHRLHETDALEALQAARAGSFTPPKFGEPNAAKYER